MCLYWKFQYVLPNLCKLGILLNMGDYWNDGGKQLFKEGNANFKTFSNG